MISFLFFHSFLFLRLSLTKLEKLDGHDKPRHIFIWLSEALPFRQWPTTHLTLEYPVEEVMH